MVNARFRFYFVVALTFVALLFSGLNGRAVAQDAVDMVGRNVSLPERISKVYATSPPETMLVYALDPTLLAGLNFPLRGRCDRLVDPHVLSLPVVGGYFGQGHTPNYEMLLKVNPDLVIGRNSNALNDKLEAQLGKFNIPLFYVLLDSLEQYPEAFELAGKALDREERGRMLASRVRSVLTEVQSKVAAIPESERVRVYYAEGNDGLLTENSKSIHAELITLAGGVNVHEEGVVSRYGREKITLERVIQYQPDVIFVEQPLFYKNIFTSPGWSNIKAVKEKRVYFIPTKPFNWFDRPPSFMRVLGLKWVAQHLYPQQFQWDMSEEIKDFFKVFLQKEIDQADVDMLLEVPR